MSPSTTTATTAPTESPVMISDTVTLSPFSLLYSFAAQSLPRNPEVTEVAMLTDDFLETFFKRAVSNLVSLDTSLTDTNFQFGAPYRMDFASTASFSGMNGPTLEELDAILVEAFSGTNLEAYLLELQALENNVFNSTTAVNLQDEAMQPQSEQNGGNAGLVIGYTVGATLLALLGLLGYNHRRRLYDYENVELEEKNAGHLTVAGETYDESTYAPTTVVSAERFRDCNSFAGGSHWAMSIQAISECGETSGSDDSCDDNSTSSTRAHSEDSFVKVSSDGNDAGVDSFVELATKTKDILDAGEESEDDDVPMRVVDLIKRCSR